MDDRAVFPQPHREWENAVRVLQVIGPLREHVAHVDDKCAFNWLHGNLFFGFVVVELKTRDTALEENSYGAKITVRAEAYKEKKW